MMRSSDQCYVLCRRSRIFLRELQNIVRQHKQERWAHPEAWPDFLAKLELLSASKGYTVYVQDFDPSGKKALCCISPAAQTVAVVEAV